LSIAACPIDRLLLNIVRAIAQFEGEIMLQRQAIGIAKAKADGKFRGRKPTAHAKTAKIRELAAAGRDKPEIAQISGRSVHRVQERRWNVTIDQRLNRKRPRRSEVLPH
jgi:DNA invertase Pin-like site-specific DNA recombinase